MLVRYIRSTGIYYCYSGFLWSSQALLAVPQEQFLSGMYTVVSYRV